MGYFTIKINNHNIEKLKKDLIKLLGNIEFYQSSNKLTVTGNFNLDDNWKDIYIIIQGARS